MRELAHGYLCPDTMGFWQWRDAGEVVVWYGETTITFRTELLEVLRRLAPHGLPPLGAVLLLLAATRDSWELASAEQSLLPPHPSTKERELTREVLLGLDLVSRLEPELRTSVEARAAIAEMVFEHSRPQLSPQHSIGVIELLEGGLTEMLLEPCTFATYVEDEDATPVTHHFSTPERYNELRALRRGLSAIDPATLKLRLATGLDALPAAAPLELPLADQIRSLLKSLDNDHEFRGLARLARDLTAAVTLPRTISDTEEMPLGGVSDISNRGPLDRLLLSEMAHDDLVLAVRVAVNEAMYLRRETPPRAPVPGRAVLLEAGIRSWGVPRVFAASVALALAATSNRRAGGNVYCAQGPTVEPVDLTRREGLVQHLAALEPDLHPGAALPAFHHALTKASIAEKVLVTTDDVLDDAEFQAALTVSGLRPLFLISISRSGRMRLLECNQRGTKLIREAHLNLADLLDDQASVSLPLIGKRAPRDLPMIFNANPFPLLLSHTIDEHLPIWLLDDQRVLAITTDRRLMLWSHRRRGAQQISTAMPIGSLLWCSYDRENRIARAAIGPRGGGSFHLLRVDLNQLQCDLLPVNLPQNVAIFSGHQGAMFACSAERNTLSLQVIVLSEITGEVIGDLQLPAGAAWRGDRFFSYRDHLQYFSIGFDGQAAYLQAIFSEKQPQRLPRLVLITEHPEVEGPIGIAADGAIVYTATGAVHQVAHRWSLLLQAETFVSACGWIMLSGGDDDHCAINLKSLVCEPLVHPSRFRDVYLRDVVHVVNHRYRFAYIYLDADGILTLVTPKGQTFGIVLETAPRKLCLRPHTAPAFGNSPRQEFQPCGTSAGTLHYFEFPLSEARWPEGSRVFLDGRGLMHLKSSDVGIPEATLVLGDGILSGWCSDGRFWGKPYFIGDHPATADQEIFESVIRPFVERLR